MKKILVAITLLLSLTTFAQNGGQFNENNAIKAAITSHTSTTVTITLTNKQPCSADYRVSYGTVDEVITIPANGTYIYTILNVAKFKVKTETSCISTDNGWVELDVLEYLPVRFEFLKVQPITNKTFKISFRVNEAETVDRFIISFSEDGRTYKSIMLVYPDKLEPNKTYTEIITIK